MIRVCYIIGQLNVAGAEKQLFQLVKGIDKQRFCPIVISLSQGGYWHKEMEEMNIQVIEIPRRKNRDLTRVFKLIRILNKLKPDIVHTYLISANFYGRIAAILLRVPVIIASERNLPEIGKDKTAFRMRVDKFLALFTDGIICNSYRAAQALISQSFNKDKIFTVHNGIEGGQARRSPDTLPTKKIASKVVGTVGRLYPQKNHHLFLEMVRAVLDRSREEDIKFMIVGDGPLRTELETCAGRLGIEDNVLFTGEKLDIPRLLSTMDIFVMTSLYEGLSNSLMEAMASGLPVVATEVGGNSELIVDGVTGFLCPSGNLSALSRAVLHLIKNADEAALMGEKGRDRILREFRTDKMVLSTESVYQLILGRKGMTQRSLGLQG